MGEGWHIVRFVLGCLIGLGFETLIMFSRVSLSHVGKTLGPLPYVFEAFKRIWKGARSASGKGILFLRYV